MAFNGMTTKPNPSLVYFIMDIGWENKWVYPVCDGYKILKEAKKKHTHYKLKGEYKVVLEHYIHAFFLLNCILCYFFILTIFCISRCVS